jgi:hypothetical protein
MNPRIPLRILILLLLALPFFALSQKTYQTSRLSGAEPVVDGIIDEKCWELVTWGSSFTQREPNDGQSPSQPTVFKILYDDNNLYVAVRAFDSVPSGIVKRITRRDNTDSDWVGLIIDSYDDNLTGFGFAVTASGVKMDLMVTNDGMDDPTWDALWLAKTNIDTLGWSAEFRIPLSQLRFAKAEELTWGLNVFRYLYRKQEMSLWQPIARNAPGFVSLFGHLNGLKGIKPKKDIEILPYTLARAEFEEKEQGNPFKKGHEYGSSVGVDGKISLTNDITLNFTVNPDFGQVEADPSVVNLSAFESYFSEKRPFFVEGKNIFNYGLTGGDGDDTRNILFYSRRIGRYPHYSPDLQDGEFADMPTNTHILGSFKISGKTRKGLSIGMLESLTRKETATIDLNGERRNVTVEPLTNYFVARIQQDYNKGKSTLGGMITATNRSIHSDYLNFLPKSSYAGGVDYNHTWKDKTYYLDLKLVGTRLEGDNEAIAELQKSSARYFQSPDKTYVELDTNRTSLSGFACTFDIGKQGNGHFNYMGWITMRSPGVDFNDVGYMRQADEIQQVVWIGYREYKPKRIFKYYGLNFNEYVGWSFGGQSIYQGANVNGFGQFNNYWNIASGFNLDAESLDRSQLRGGPALMVPGGYNYWFDLSSDGRKKLNLGFNTWLYRGFEDYTSMNGISLSATYKPVNSLSVSVSPDYSWGFNELQYVTDLEHDGTARYILARLDQRSFGVSVRVDYALTPDLSIQYYGQPFLFSGDYSHFKRVTDAKASDYSARYSELTEGVDLSRSENEDEWLVDEDRNGQADYSFTEDDFNFMQFRSNLVLRWEYRPGSSLYLVWSQGRTQDDTRGDFAFRRDMNYLFDKHPQDILLIKVSYMLVF